jgi:hypothetical protein
MRREWSVGILKGLWRRQAKREKVLACNELDRAKNPPRANQACDELQESCRVSPSCVRTELTGPSGSEQKPPARPAENGRLCAICAEPSETMICGSCADKIGADALEKKRWEEKGKP